MGDRMTYRDLLYYTFNQDYTFFAVGTSNGFKVFNADPLEEKMKQEFETAHEGSGIGIVSMLFRSNYIGLVGGGRNPKFPTTKAFIWDDFKKKTIYELTFLSEVKNLKLRKDQIVVVLTNRVYVYSFQEVPRLLLTFETSKNSRGLVALSSSSDRVVLAVPGLSRGHIQIIELPTTTISTNGLDTSELATLGLTESFDLRSPDENTSKYKSISIAAHTSDLACIALNPEGTLLASASETGTLIRIFDTTTGQTKCELRRGIDKADIFCIAFNLDSTLLSVASDKGTVHLFKLAPELNPSESSGFLATSPTNSYSGKRSSIESGNRQSNLAFMQGYLPKYFSSEWSFAKFQVPSQVACQVGFVNGSNSNALIILCSDGGYYRVTFDLRNGGDCSRDVYRRFYKP